MYWKKALGLAVLVPAVAIQFLPIGNRQNPPIQAERSYERHLQLNGEIHAMMRRACLDCHSNETRWPWYSSVAPLSWVISGDVERGRKVLNFSEWSVQAGRRPEIGASMLMAACAATKTGRMPRFPYGMLHPDAKLSPEEVQTFCAWTNSETQRLFKLKRHQRKTAAGHRQAIPPS
jgi:Haem-binding domain